MSARRLRIAILLVAVMAGAALVVVGAVVANDAGPEGVYFNSTGEGVTAYAPVDEHSGLPWFIAGFALLMLSLSAGVLRAEVRRRRVS
jgi:hypothetical protein